MQFLFFVLEVLYLLCKYLILYVNTSSLQRLVYYVTFVLPYKNSIIMNSNNDPFKKAPSFDTLPSLVLQLSHNVHEIQKDLEYIKSNLYSKEPEEYLTRQEMANKLKVDISTIHNWVKKGILKPHTIGNRVYFLKSENELK